MKKTIIFAIFALILMGCELTEPMYSHPTELTECVWKDRTGNIMLEFNSENNIVTLTDRDVVTIYYYWSYRNNKIYYEQKRVQNRDYRYDFIVQRYQMTDYFQLYIIRNTRNIKYNRINIKYNGREYQLFKMK